MASGRPRRVTTGSRSERRRTSASARASPGRPCWRSRIPANDYMDVALPVKLFDSMAAGRPLVVTPRRETAAIVERGGVGLVTADDDPASIAAVCVRLLTGRDPRPTHGRGGADAGRAGVRLADRRQPDRRRDPPPGRAGRLASLLVARLRGGSVAFEPSTARLVSASRRNPPGLRRAAPDPDERRDRELIVAVDRQQLDRASARQSRGCGR